MINEHPTTAIAFWLIAALFVVIETAPVVVKLLAPYGPYDTLVEHKETEVTLSAHRQMADIPDKLQRESTTERAIDEVAQHFVCQQFEQAIHRAASSPDFAALDEAMAARIREGYRETMLRTIRRVFRAAVPVPDVMGLHGQRQPADDRRGERPAGKLKPFERG